MRAVIMRDGKLIVDEVSDPVPGPGQVLARTLACGICGSDLHTLQHPDAWVELAEHAGDATPEGLPALKVMDIGRDVVMGHEFCAEVVELGPGATNLHAGDRVVSLPVAFDTAGLHSIGYSNLYPGGYGELVVLNELLSLPVPNGLDASRAALTEPMAVGLHAVNLGELHAGNSAVVLGCGPVGLAVIAALAQHHVEPIVATDFSPARRALALRMGAHVAVDPREQPAIEAWRKADGRSRVVVFEAVGVPGMLDEAMATAPRRSRIVVVGVCMEADPVHPLRYISKEHNLQFSFGYDPAEFGATLTAIAEGAIDVTPLITGTVPLDGVAGAFTDLREPDKHAKILVVP